MNYETRIKALEERLGELQTELNTLKQGVPQAKPKDGTKPGYVRLQGIKEDGSPYELLRIEGDGTFTVKGQKTEDATVIGNAVKQFQADRMKHFGKAKLVPLVLTPRGDA